MIVVSLAVITFLVFLNAINHPFVHDDFIFIVQNPQIARIDQIGKIFSSNVQFPQTPGFHIYYRPILEFVYRLEYHFFGFQAPLFHLVNIFIHIVNGLLLFVLLKELQFSRNLAFVVSLLFLVHPLQSEPVACVAGISNLLFCFFILLMLYWHVKGLSILSFIFLIFALFTKEQAVMAVPLLMLVDWYRGRKNNWAFGGICLLGTLAFLFLRSAITGSHMLGEFHLNFLAIIPRTILMYLRLIVLPYDLHYFRNMDALAPNGPSFVILGILLAVLVWAVRKLQLNGREVIFGVAWFIICLLPVLNIIPVFTEYSFVMTAEHFLYLPMAGIVLILALILRRLLSRRLLGGITLIGGIFLGAMTIYQNAFWRGEIPLFERMVAFENNFGRGHLLLAGAYFDNHQWSKALEHYNRALEIKMGYVKKSGNLKGNSFYTGYFKEIYFEMAECWQVLGKPEVALKYYQEALRLDVHNVRILHHMAVCYVQIKNKVQ